MPRRKSSRLTPVEAVITLFFVATMLAGWIFQNQNVTYFCIGASFIALILLGIFMALRRGQQSLEQVNRIRDNHLQWTHGRLGALSPYEFEHVVTQLYKDMGYRAQHTGRAGDNGVDILVYDKSGDKYVVQCKHTTVGSVGAGAIRDLLGTVARERAVSGILCTNGDFTQPARNTAAGHPILLYNGDEIIKHLNLMQRKKDQGK